MQSHFFSETLARVKPSATLTIGEKARKLKAQGVDIISLSAGEPDFDTPETVKQAAIKAIHAGKTKYTPVAGIPELKQAIIHKFRHENNIEYTEEEVIVSPGGKAIIYNALVATLNTDDEVLIPAPFWVSYPDMVKLAGGMPKIIKTELKDNYKVTPEVLEKSISKKTKWLILNSPSNPTGTVYSEEELQTLAKILLKHPHIHILSDDIYEHLIYGDIVFKTLAEIEPGLKERILTVNGVSKSYAMTGWRIGYAGGSRALIAAMTKVMSQTTSNACSIAQWAAVEALQGKQDFIAEHNKTFQQRRNLVVEAFNQTPGLSCFMPEGAFYVFPDCAGFIGRKTPQGRLLETDIAIAEALLEEVNVAVIPGTAFGISPAFRVSYASATALIEKACERIITFASSLRG